MNKYKNIEFGITEEDIRLFQEIINGNRDWFTWTSQGVNVIFRKAKEEDNEL